MKTIKILTISLILLGCSSVLAQPGNQWIRYYDYQGDHELAYGLFAMRDGGYAICGNTQRGSLWIVVTENNGGLLWQNVYRLGDRRNHNGICIIQTDNGDFVVGGYVEVVRGNLPGAFSVLRVSQDGVERWWGVYNEDGVRGECRAVIETKDGNLLAAGWGWDNTPAIRGYAVMLNHAGDIIWERMYSDQMWFYALREIADEGFLLAGRSATNESSLVRIDSEGDTLWTRTYGNGYFVSLASCRGDGFTALNYYRNLAFALVHVDNDGIVRWTSSFEFDDFGEEVEYWSVSPSSMSRANDDGYYVVGELRIANSIISHNFILRTDSQGNQMWLRLDQHSPPPGHSERYTSVVVDRDGMAVVAGFSVTPDNRGFDGVLLKLAPDRSGPIITERSPEKTELIVLRGDTVSFSVVAFDWQDDPISYVWTLDDDDIALDTAGVSIVFEEFGTFRVGCVAYDDEGEDATHWIVDVRDYHISAHYPEELTLTIRRNSTVDFAIDVRELEGDPILYDWSIQERPHGGRENVAEDTTAYSHTFPFSAEYAVEALARRGEREDSRVWRVFVRSAIQNYYPREEAMSIPKGTMRDFWIEPFDPESDSLEYSWTLNGEAIGDTAEVSLLFEDVGQYEVIAYLLDGAELDSQMWVVNVFDPEFAPYDDYTLPSVFALHPAYPNPFNNQTQIRFDIPIAIEVSVSVFDIRGRLVATLAQGTWSAGSHSVVWDGGYLMSGIYFVKMEVSSSFRRKPESRENVFIQKAVLVK